jgi:hypothetical protein
MIKTFSLDNDKLDTGEMTFTEAKDVHMFVPLCSWSIVNISLVPFYRNSANSWQYDPIYRPRCDIACFHVTNHSYHGFPNKTVKQSQASHLIV